nr:MAG TPA: hypothetical protein [Caudoviricetes sp.]
MRPLRREARQPHREARQPLRLNYIRMRIS